MDFSTYQVTNLLHLLTRPAGIFALLVVICVGALVISVRPLKWWIVTLVMYTATFGYTAVTKGDLYFPLNLMRAFGRTICGVGLILLLVPTFTADPQWRRRTVMGAAVAFYIMEVVLSLRAALGGDFERFFLALLTYTLMFTTLLIGVSRWIQSPKDAIDAVRPIGFAGGLFILGTLYQYLMDRSQVSWSGRMFGTAGNANHAATALGTTFPAICFMLTRPGKKINRIFIALAAASVVVMLMWTGSRTGFVICLVGTAVLFRFRLGTILLAGIVVAALAIALLGVFTDAGQMAERLMSMDNTRSGAWNMMLEDFRRNPILGTNVEEARASENSYLLIAARAGIIGLIPLAVAMVLTIRSLIQLQRARRWLGDQKLLADLVTAGFCSLAVGGMFEGYLFAVYNISLYAMFVYWAVLSYLLDYAELQQEMALVEPPMDEYESAPQMAETYHGG